MFVLFLAHHVLNGSWHKNLFRGKYPPMRIFLTVIDVLTLLSMIAQMYSGIVLSRHVFAFCRLKAGLHSQVVCMDEKPYQFLGEAREPLPVIPGSDRKTDSEYTRNGIVSIFALEPPGGTHHVMDSLNTHKPASLYKRYCRDEARRIIKKLEICKFRLGR